MQIFVVFYIGMFCLAIAGVIGWIMNIIKIIASLGDPTITPLFVARIVGAFAAPIGAVLGFF